MYLCFRDVKAATSPVEYSPKASDDGLGIELEITVGSAPVTVNLYDVIPTENPSLEEHKNSILTRVQGKNDLKMMTFKRRLPGYVKLAISELEPLSEE
jgi:hypothetical protein